MMDGVYPLPALGKCIELSPHGLSLASLFMNQNSRTASNSWGEQGLEGVRGQRKWCDLSHLCCLFAEQRQEGAAG